MQKISAYSCFMWPDTIVIHEKQVSAGNNDRDGSQMIHLSVNNKRLYVSTDAFLNKTSLDLNLFRYFCITENIKYDYENFRKTYCRQTVTD